jgi:hypothetical protein
MVRIIIKNNSKLSQLLATKETLQKRTERIQSYLSEENPDYDMQSDQYLIVSISYSF